MFLIQVDPNPYLSAPATPILRSTSNYRVIMKLPSFLHLNVASLNAQLKNVLHLLVLKEVDFMSLN